MATAPGDGEEAAEPPVRLTVLPGQGGVRLDKALAAAAAAVPGLSRSRLAQLITAGAVRDPEGRTVTDVRSKVKPGTWQVDLPPPAPAEPEPEAIPLSVAYEDDALLVIDKPPGMVVHPAPGAGEGTLVNALLHHCGDSLSGIGGTARPGIVHRIDKDTSGLLVVAKTQGAHEALAEAFAAHRVERRYLAVLWGVPEAAEPRLAGLAGVEWEPGGWLRIDRPLGRHPSDRKRMAVVRTGKHAITRLQVRERFGGNRPFASLAECRLETGRTHQIRVHAAHIGHALVGDPVYGRNRTLPRDVDETTAAALTEFPRQALHAATLGFVHPVDGRCLRFEAVPPADMQALIAALRRNDGLER